MCDTNFTAFGKTKIVKPRYSVTIGSKGTSASKKVSNIKTKNLIANTKNDTLHVLMPTKTGPIKLVLSYGQYVTYPKYDANQTIA